MNSSMLSKIKTLLSSYFTTIVLLVIYAIGLAIATFIEKYEGITTAKALVYNSPCFFVLQLLMVINFVALVVKHQFYRKKRWGMMLIHIAFFIILVGASVSYLFSEEGILHIRQGESSNEMVINTVETHTLPFEVELVKFTLTRYPGSSSPSSYESELLIHIDGEVLRERIYMNNVLDLKGYRFFQASYDKDELGTVLTVNKDVAGRTITYVGYFILLLGFLYCLVEPQSRFRFLIRRMREANMNPKAILIVCFLGASLSSAFSQNDDKTTTILSELHKISIDAKHLESFGATPIQSYTGRMMPINTFSSEILRKIAKKTQIHGFTPDEFMLSLFTFPEVWMQTPLIDYSNEALSNIYDLPKSPCAFLDLFDEEGNYKLNEMTEKAYAKPLAERTAFDKDLLKLDEKANILHQLFNFQLINLFPKEDEPNHTWFAPGDDLSTFAGKDSLLVAQIFPWYISEVRASVQTGTWSEPDRILEMIHIYQNSKNKTLDISPQKINTELTYNRLDVFRYSKIGYLSLGGILLVLSFLALFRNSKLSRYLKLGCIIGVILVFCWHTYGMSLRWQISGHAPWSNSYETMVYVAWATVFAGLIFMRSSQLTFALATLFGGIILFVSGLNWMDPEINPLVPVLKSPWLMFHVAVIVAAYGFFGISCLLGITNQILMIMSKSNKNDLGIRIRELTTINEISLWIGLMLMTIGTFLGAIWANESWGRYWGWDPKETWALITLVIYAGVLHLRLAEKWYSVWLFNVLSTLSFASVLMTFFGVNYFLSGMHSYGQNDAVDNIFVYLIGGSIVVLLLAVFSYQSSFSRKVQRS